MKTLRYALLGLILAGGLLVAPPAKAQTTMEIFKMVLNEISKNSDFPSGDTLEGVFNCIDNPTGDLFGCAELAAEQSGNKSYVETFNKVIQMYVAIDAGQYWDVLGIAATWLGQNAPCILADILAPGVGGNLCSLVKELIELAESLVDAGKAIVAFVSDILDAAGAVLEAISDAACDVLDWGCDSPPPPPPAYKIVYAHTYAPQVEAGINAIEFTEEAFTHLEAQLYTEAAVYLGSVKGSLSGVSTGVQQAATLWKNTVDAQWSVDVTGKVSTALGQARSQYQQDIESHIDKIIAEDAKNGPHAPYTPDAKIRVACDKSFNMYAHYDRWIDKHPDKAQQAAGAKFKMVKVKDWCNDIGPKYQDMYQVELAEYVDSVCPELKCRTVENYKDCQGAMGGIGQKEQCLMDVAAVGYNAAYDIWKFLADRSQLAKNECKIDAKTPTDPKLIVAAAQALGAGSTPSTATAKAGQPGQAMAQGPVTMAPKSSSAGKSSVLGAIKSGKTVTSLVPKAAVLECPRPMHGYWCEKKYKEDFAGVKTGQFNFPLVACKVAETEPYSTMEKNVKTVLASSNYGLSPAYNDPLLVSVSTKPKFDLLANKDFFTQPPKQFAQLIALSVPELAKIDGVNVPTVFLDQSVGLKEDLKATPVGMQPKPSPEAGKPTVSPVAGLAQAAKAPLNIPGPTGQIGSMDKATSGQTPGRASAPSSSTTAKAAPALNPAMAAAVAGSRATPSVANQVNPATPTSGPAPQSRGAVPPASATAGRLASVAPAATATPTGAGPATVRSSAAASGPAPANQPPLSAQATVPATRSAPAAQPSTRSGPAPAQTPAATTTATAASASPITPQLANAVTLAAQRDNSGAVRTFNAAAAPWKALTAPQAAPQGCPCAPLYAQIIALQQRSTALVKEGESQVQSVNTGRLDAAATGKAAQRLGEISKQLDVNLAQNKSLTGQYETQLKNFRLQSAPAPVRR